ncbi:MAG: hypothetical protein ACPGSO_06870 [Vicingaceae bacterium]
METGLIHIHSLFRWLTVAFLVIAIIKSLAGWLGKKEYNKSDNLVALLLLSFTHTQFLLGLGLYFVSSKVIAIGEAMSNSAARFWSMEHGLIMLIAIALITIGRVKSKKATTDELKHKKGAIFYIIAFILILWAGIVKPMLLGSGLF